LVKGTNMIDYAKQLAEQVKGMEGVDDTMPGKYAFYQGPFGTVCSLYTLCKRINE
jgi:hypothetical protein